MPRPLIIIGAARSGTKFLRSLFAAHPDCAVVPYGIPLVWRDAVPDTSHDALSATDASPEVARALRRRIRALADGPPSGRLVEKTSANTLRVSFVRRVFPNARFVHLVRDGMDVVESAHRRWQARRSVSWFSPTWLRYVAKKTFHHPGATLRSLFRSRLSSRLDRADNIPPIWGPIYPGMRNDLRTHSLLCVCALQWRTCVTTACDALTELPPDDVHTVRYESLVTDAASFHSVVDFANLAPAPCLAAYHASVRSDSIGRGRRSLTDEQITSIAPIMAPPLSRLAYAPPFASL